MVSEVIQSGLAGIQQGLKRTDEAAQKIASAGLSTGVGGSTPTDLSAQRSDRVSDVTPALVELKLYERSVEASARVVKTGDEALGTLIDTTA